MHWLRAAILGFLPLALGAQNYQGLPEWAWVATHDVDAVAPPAGADAWILLDRSEVSCGDGEVKIHRLRVARILTEQGMDASELVLREPGARLLKLKGWNRKPDGESTRLTDEDRVVVQYGASLESGAKLAKVVPGSIVAYDCEVAERVPVGGAMVFSLMEKYPVRRLEILAAPRSMWFRDPDRIGIQVTPEHLKPWLAAADADGRSFGCLDLPPMPRREGATPYEEAVLPRVRVAFKDPGAAGVNDWTGWDPLAVWTARQFREKGTPLAVPGAEDPDPAGRLRQIWAWLGRNFHYQQLFLTPDRGWVPEVATESLRKAYGDCKDLTCLVLAAAAKAGIQGAPALASIHAAPVHPEDPPAPRHNHVIAALKLDRSLGLPAEVATPEGIFLLADATDPVTPLGWLHSAHRGRQVLICLPDGARWVAVPDAAIRAEGLSLALDGAVDASGRLQGTLTVTEEGDAFALRSTAIRAGPVRLHEALVTRVLHLPPSGNLKILSQGDPNLLDRPFTVTLELVVPDALTASRGGSVLSTLGFLGLPGQPQPPGQARQFPVELGPAPRKRLAMTLRLPARMVPALPEASLRTVRRNLDWKAGWTPDGAGSRVTLALDMDCKAVGYGFDTREEGVQALRKDRNAFRNFLDDAFFLKRAGD